MPQLNSELQMGSIELISSIYIGEQWKYSDMVSLMYYKIMEARIWFQNWDIKHN